jgi:biotin operon repressor
MLCEHAGYTIKALPMIITRLRKDGWNIKNYHGYYELEDGLHKNYKFKKVV